MLLRDVLEERLTVAAEPRTNVARRRPGRSGARRQRPAAGASPAAAERCLPAVRRRRAGVGRVGLGAEGRARRPAATSLELDVGVLRLAPQQVEGVLGAEASRPISRPVARSIVRRGSIASIRSSSSSEVLTSVLASPTPPATSSASPRAVALLGVQPVDLARVDLEDARGPRRRRAPGRTRRGAEPGGRRPVPAPARVVVQVGGVLPPAARSACMQGPMPMATWTGSISAASAVLARRHRVTARDRGGEGDARHVAQPPVRARGGVLEVALDQGQHLGGGDAPAPVRRAGRHRC